MGVAAHLGIRIDEYDARIRTFIPAYESMLDAAADTLRGLRRRKPVILDLGIGSAGLAARCLSRAPGARLIGIDEDAEMLGLARRRLPGRVRTITGSFLSTELPRCDAIVASLALHHVRTPHLKRALYRRCADALRPGGLLVNADCCLARTAAVRARQRAAWRRHLLRTYSAAEADGFLRAWAREDTYFAVDDEITMLRAAGFTTDVRWRRNSFVVIVGVRG
jgi:tRNA (cmo5U34)-methyltransferase